MMPHPVPNLSQMRFARGGYFEVVSRFLDVSICYQLRPTDYPYRKIVVPITRASNRTRPLEPASFGNVERENANQDSDWHRPFMEETFSNRCIRVGVARSRESARGD